MGGGGIWHSVAGCICLLFACFVTLTSVREMAAVTLLDADGHCHNVDLQADSSSAWSLPIRVNQSPHLRGQRRPGRTGRANVRNARYLSV